MARFARAHQLEASAEVRLLDPVSEVGELAKEHLKSSAYGRKEFRPIGEWKGELGDVVFSLVCLVNETIVDLDPALEGALDKYEKRLGRKGDAGSGS